MNAAPLVFDADAQLEVGKLRYRDEQHLTELRSALRDTHVVRRSGDALEVVGVTAGTEPYGECIETVRAGEARGLVASLCLAALLRHFVSLNRDVRRHRPVTVVSSRPQDNILVSSLPMGVSLPNWVARWVTYELGTRMVFRDSGPPMLLLAAGVGTTTIIDAPCRTLLRAGVPLEGRYVQVVAPGDDPRLVERRHLVGRVVTVDGDRLVLDDHVTRYPTVGIDEAYLEPRIENVQACLRAIIGRKRADVVSRRLREITGTIKGGPSQLERVRALFNYLRQQAIEMVPGKAVRFGNLLSTNDAGFPLREVMERPHYIFDPSGRRTHRWGQGGLDKHGPYDRVMFTPKRLRIAIVCQARHQGRVEQFIAKFFEGEPQGPYSKGFVRRFMLERPDVHVFRARAPTARAYKQALEKAVSAAADGGFRWNLAIVQIEDTFRELGPNRNPYLVCKSALFRHQVAVQSVTLRTMTLRGSQLGYALNNLSIQTYAKLGGTPWVLPADGTIAHELVIGLGSYQVAGARLGGRERYVGLTTVFTGDGRYLLDGRTAAVPFADYGTAMLKVISRAIQALREEQNWRDNAPVRLVFHAFKPMKGKEIAAVKKLMGDLGMPQAEFAFVHLVENHPFAAFNLGEMGAKAARGQKKGKMAPPRGLHLKFGLRESLVAFKGPREVKGASDGLPLPVLLRLHPDSTFDDLTYLSRQAFAFSCHSWRSFFPAPMPITILYSRFIANLLAQLQQVDGWAADSMLGKIGRTRWFL